MIIIIITSEADLQGGSGLAIVFLTVIGHSSSLHMKLRPWSSLGCTLYLRPPEPKTTLRARHETRSVVASEIRATFTVDSPVLLHWDGKLLPDISGSKEVVDRVAILVTSGYLQQLLAVPKIGCGTGQQQCDACLCALDDWQLRSKVRGLVFDTTSSNTGLNLGACTLIEKALKRELI